MAIAVVDCHVYRYEKGHLCRLQWKENQLKYIIELYPNFRLKMGEDGCLYMILMKGIYGCVQGSTLWYALIKSFLESWDTRAAKWKGVYLGRCIEIGYTFPSSTWMTY